MLLVTMTWSKLGGLVGIIMGPLVVIGNEMLMDVFGISDIATDPATTRPKL